MIGDSLVDAISTKANLQSLLAKDKKLTCRIMDYVRNFVSEMKQIVARIGRHSPEAAAMQQNLDKAQDVITMYDSLIQEAGEKYQANAQGGNIGGPGQAVNEKYSCFITRDLNYSTKDELPPETKMYLEAVDQGLLDFYNQHKDDKNATIARYTLGPVSQAQADRILQLTGWDMNGHTNNITNSDTAHINIHHGQYGKADASMADVNDVARMQYILESFDKVNLLRDKKDGSIIFSSK